MDYSFKLFKKISIFQLYCLFFIFNYYNPNQNPNPYHIQSNYVLLKNLYEYQMEP